MYIKKVENFFANYNISYLKYDLNRIRVLIKKSEINLKRIKFIHITGSKGKGSTAFYISQFLISAGLNTGLYTSPHLFEIIERIKINNQNIGYKKLWDLLCKYKKIITEIRPSYFELLTFLAFVYFYEQQVDWAVIEVGLGGRYDATNIINSKISVITNIEFEHCGLLGNTKEKILREKMMIIKKNSICITSIKIGKLLSILKEYCETQNSDLINIHTDSKISFKKNLFSYSDNYYNFNRIKFKNNSGVQADNIAIALKTVSLLTRKYKIRFDEKKLKEIISEKAPFGRFTILKFQKMNLPIIFDVAHTPESMKYLMKNLKSNNFKKNIFIFNCLKDKNYKSMLDIISNYDSKIYILSIDTDREIDFLKLKNYLLKKRIKFYSICAVKELFKKIFLKEFDAIVVTGSFYVVSKVLTELNFKTQDF